MRNLVFTLAITIAFGACAKKDPKKSIKAAGSNPQVEKKFEKPNVKYPAAVVIEGGTGRAMLDDDGSRHTPAWRLYICLEKSGKPQTGYVELDFAILGNPVERKIEDSATKELRSLERLKKVRIDYNYAAELPDREYGYVFGTGSFKSKSQQDWELVKGNPNVDYQFYRSFSNHQDFFDLELGSGSIVYFRELNYELNNQKYYISAHLERFIFDEKGKRAELIKACEEADQHHVWQFGEQIKKHDSK